MIKKLSNLLISLGLLLILCLSAFADTIKLKDGSIIKGKVIGFRDGQFIVLVGSGSRMRQMNFYADEVESIEFDSVTAFVDQYNLSMNKLESRISEGKSASTTLQTNSTNTDNNRQTEKSSKTEPTSGSQTTNKADSTANYPVSQTIAQSKTTTESKQRTESEITIEPKSQLRPVRLKVKVLADNTANGWTSVGWVVKKGQRIRIIGKGQVYLGGGKFSGPEGMKNLPDPEKLIPQAPTGALIAVIGDDNNDFIFIGAENEFIAEREGVLFLGVNEGNLDDNSGAFDVTVEIYP
jgi:hypothetical protein